jgi:hypothetical protein
VVWHCLTEPAFPAGARADAFATGRRAAAGHRRKTSAMPRADDSVRQTASVFAPSVGRIVDFALLKLVIAHAGGSTLVRPRSSRPSYARLRFKKFYHDARQRAAGRDLHRLLLTRGLAFDIARVTIARSITC